MRVMITGATGFIGYHTTRALLVAGHEVSLLVRSEDKMRRMFGPDTIEHYTVGDIVDRVKVRESMADCDAVIHIAALVSTRASDAQRVYNTNLTGVREVIGGALNLGLGPVIHVSSVTALYDPSAAVLDEYSPPGVGRTGYGRSKVACEKFVRSLQEQGEPVHITYPATVLGPDTPELTEAHVGLQTYLSHFIPLMSSGNQYVDVRDLADFHLQLLELEPEPGRFLLGGHYVPWRELGPKLHELTGKKPRQLPLSSGMMRLLGRACDELSRFVDLEVPMTAEGLEYATRWVLMDNSKVEQELGFEFRPLEDTLVDSIRWLFQEGHLAAEQVGKLAQEA